jgi:hypothetical protein
VTDEQGTSFVTAGAQPRLWKKLALFAQDSPEAWNVMGSGGTAFQIFVGVMFSVAPIISLIHPAKAFGLHY